MIGSEQRGGEADLGVDISISTLRVSRVSTADLPLSQELCMLAVMIMSFSVSSVVLLQEPGGRSC